MLKIFRLPQLPCHSSVDHSGVARENPTKNSFFPSRPIGDSVVSLTFLSTDQTLGLIQRPLSLNRRKFCF